MYFKPENAMEYLVRLSEHPSVNVQSFVTNYLTLYAADKPDVLRQLDTYFRSVLMRVNRARVAKDRVFTFLHREALKSEEAAGVAVPLLNDLSAQSSVRDKATCIDILTDIKKLKSNKTAFKNRDVAHTTSLPQIITSYAPRSARHEYRLFQFFYSDISEFNY